MGIKKAQVSRLRTGTFQDILRLVFSLQSNRVVSVMSFTHKDFTYAGTLGQSLLELVRERTFGHVMLIIPSFLVKVI